MEYVFIKLLNLSISAGYMVLALILLRPLLKKAPKFISCLLWALVGLRLCLPVSLESILSLIPSAETVPPEILYSKTPQLNTGIPFLEPITLQSMTPDPVASVNPMQIVMIIGANLWILGMLVMVLYALISYLTLRHKLREAVQQTGNIWLCDRVSSPFLLGLFRPRIYLPSHLSEENAAYVIAHEQAHLQRRDHWWKPLGFLLLTVYWFNPLMWVAYILLCRDIEYACDEKVLKSMGAECKKAYSEALVSCSAPRKMITACPVAFGEDGVKSRIRSVLNYKKPAFWIILTAVLAGVALAVCFLTDPAQKTEQSYQFRATVVEIQGESILISPVEGERENSSSDLFTISVSDTLAAQLHCGDTLRITYDGIIQELYPAILPNVTGIEIEYTCTDYSRDPMSELDIDLHYDQEYKLIIYAYELGENIWRFQFVKNSRPGHTALSLMQIDSMDLEAARKLLKSYDLNPEEIPVIVYNNPISSYLHETGSYAVDTARQLLFLPD